MNHCQRGRRLRRSDGGLSTLQLTIAAPILLWWLMLIVQYGLWWHAKQVADTAAAEAVDAAQTPSGTAGDGEAAARSYLAEVGNLESIRIVVDRYNESVTATVHGNAPQLVPLLSWAVTAEGHGPVERFRTEAER